MSAASMPRSVHTWRRGAMRGRAFAVVAALAPLLALFLAGCGAQAGAWRLLTPPNSHVISLAADPHIPTLIYAGSDDGSVYRARADQPGLAAPGAGIPGNVAVAALSPDPKIAGRVLAGTTAGLYKSDHYGDNWIAYGKGLPATFATVALATTPDDSVLLAGTDSHGIYRSADNGATWAPSSAGLPSGSTVTALTWDATAHLWWAGLTGGVAHSLYESGDAGQTWQPADQLVKAGVDINGLAAMRSAGSSADTIFAATSGGVYTNTGGGNWSKAHGALPATSALAVMALPDKPDAVVVSFGSSVYASTDGGVTWSVLAQGLTNPVSALGVAKDKKGATVYFAASGQLARYPSGANTTTDSTSYLLVTLIAALLVSGGYLIMRRGRNFGYAMGANDNEATAGPGAAAARARERQRAAEATAHEAALGGRRGGGSRGGALTPDDLTSRKQTGAPAKSDKAASNGHGDPKRRG